MYRGYTNQTYRGYIYKSDIQRIYKSDIEQDSILYSLDEGKYLYAETLKCSENTKELPFCNNDSRSCGHSFTHVLRYILILLMQHSGDVAGQFTAAPPTCPGSNLTFSCTVGGDRSGVTIWRVDGSSECVLTHSTAGATATCGPGSAFKARPGAEFGTSATSYSSTLSGTATSALNGTLVECFGPDLVREPSNKVGGSTLKILGNGLRSSFLTVRVI